jgi:amidase
MPSFLIEQTAVETVSQLCRGDITPHDLLDALEERIAGVDPVVNALPTRCFDRARLRADRLMQLPLNARGPLAGLPVPIKDLTDVSGVRTTYGSTVFADHVPAESDLLVEGLEANGAIIYAKSNTPEFGAGANTFNDVFGATLNPWDTRLSAAGSSGGAAVALATGMAWVAHGSDFGGSLRNPASFCNVVGFRPTPGRVRRTPDHKIDDLLNTQGPMGRNVSDCALLFDAMCGDDARDPISMPIASSCLAATRNGWRPRRVAYSPDLGITPVDPEIARLTRHAANRLADDGIDVVETHPDLSDAHACFGVLRAYAFAASKADLLVKHRSRMKPELVWNIEKGLTLTAAELIHAEHLRAKMFRNMLTFFNEYDLLLCPTTIVPPFPVAQRFVDSCNGVSFSNYIEWLGIAYAVSLVACPAMSLPCGFTATGMPVGMQIIGRPHADAQVFSAGRLLEDYFELNTSRPISPRAFTSREC